MTLPRQAPQKQPTASAARAPTRPAGPARTLMARQEATLVAVLVAVGVIATLRSPAFGGSANLVQILRASVETFIVACPLTLVTIGGGFDFSVGSVFTLGETIGIAEPGAIFSASFCAFSFSGDLKGYAGFEMRR